MLKRNQRQEEVMLQWLLFAQAVGILGHLLNIEQQKENALNNYKKSIIIRAGNDYCGVCDFFRNRFNRC